MKRRVYDEEGHGHFLTFSCCKRRQLLDCASARGIVLHWLARQLERRQGQCARFVVMPNHVHAVVRFGQPGELSTFVQQWKRLSSRNLKAYLNRNKSRYMATMRTHEPIWQPHFYDFNIHGDKKLAEKLNYMHNNPVRAGLTEIPTEWMHSSARWYELNTSVGVPLQRFC